MTVDSGDAAATKILLSESEMPRRWYNVVADLPASPPPVLHPGTKEPVGRRRGRGDGLAAHGAGLSHPSGDSPTMSGS
jgi:hypothetical protein